MVKGVMTGVGSYLRIDEDGSPIPMNEEPKEDDYQLIEEGSLEIIRFIPFSEQASQAVGGAKGRWERLIVEATTEDEPKEEEGVETEPEVQWATEWEPIE